MSHCSSSCQVDAALDARLKAICNALAELNRVVAQRTNNEQRIEHNWGILLGEMDWRRELGRLLYESC